MLDVAMARARLGHATKLVEIAAALCRGAGKLRAVRSVAKLHIEDIPALAAGGLNDWRCGMLIGNSRDAISVDLPVTRGCAVGRQELRFYLRSIG
jgi:hypothetical protein